MRGEVQAQSTGLDPRWLEVSPLRLRGILSIAGEHMTISGNSHAPRRSIRMLTETVADSRAWTAASIDDPAGWYYSLPDICAAVFEQVQRDRRKAPQALATIQLPQSVRAACAEALQPVRAALESGRGFAIVEGPAGAPLASDDAQLL